MWQVSWRWSLSKITTLRDWKDWNDVMSFWSHIWVWLIPGYGQFNCWTSFSSPCNEDNSANLVWLLGSLIKLYVLIHLHSAWRGLGAQCNTWRGQKCLCYSSTQKHPFIWFCQCWALNSFLQLSDDIHAIQIFLYNSTWRSLLTWDFMKTKNKQKITRST